MCIYIYTHMSYIGGRRQAAHLGVDQQLHGRELGLRAQTRYNLTYYKFECYNRLCHINIMYATTHYDIL